MEAELRARKHQLQILVGVGVGIIFRFIQYIRGRRRRSTFRVTSPFSSPAPRSTNFWHRRWRTASSMPMLSQNEGLDTGNRHGCRPTEDPFEAALNRRQNKALPDRPGTPFVLVFRGPPLASIKDLRRAHRRPRADTAYM